MNTNTTNIKSLVRKTTVAGRPVWAVSYRLIFDNKRLVHLGSAPYTDYSAGSHYFRTQKAAIEFITAALERGAFIQSTTVVIDKTTAA
jgi:hypothetical protein